MRAQVEVAVEYLVHFQKRVVQDAFAEAESSYWTTRADQFEQAMPQPGDFAGNATAAELEEGRVRLASIVAACRQRAVVSMFGGAE